MWGESEKYPTFFMHKCMYVNWREGRRLKRYIESQMKKLYSVFMLDLSLWEMAGGCWKQQLLILGSDASGFALRYTQSIHTYSTENATLHEDI